MPSAARSLHWKFQKVDFFQRHHRKGCVLTIGIEHHRGKAPGFVGHIVMIATLGADQDTGGSDACGSNLVCIHIVEQRRYVAFIGRPRGRLFAHLRKRGGLAGGADRRAFPRRRDQSKDHGGADNDCGQDQLPLFLQTFQTFHVYPRGSGICRCRFAYTMPQIFSDVVVVPGQMYVLPMGGTRNALTSRACNFGDVLHERKTASP